MTILVNNDLTVIPDGTTVNDVVRTILQLNPAGIAIAINDTIVPKHLWESTCVQLNDKMLVIKACSGG